MKLLKPQLCVMLLGLRKHNRITLNKITILHNILQVLAMLMTNKIVLETLDLETEPCRVIQYIEVRYFRKLRPLFTQLILYKRIKCSPYQRLIQKNYFGVSKK